MPYIPNEALTREQGEQIIDVLKGEEPKEYGYPYTNEVLNKEQGDRIIKAFKIFKDGIPTEGLPDPSSLPDGTAMVVVNGKWKMQDRYGWIEEGTFTNITWDGDTEDRDAIYVELEGQQFETHYKVSDLVFTKDSVLGGKVTINGVDYNIHDFNIVDNESDDYASSTAQFTAVTVDALAVISCTEPGIIRFTDMGTTIEYHCLTTGIYFFSFVSQSIDSYVSSLTYGTPDTVHQFDPELIPSSGWPVDLPKPSSGGYGYTEHIEQAVITWDGDTEGRETLMPDEPFYKVSDNGVPASLLIGATIVHGGDEIIVTQDMIREMIDGVVMVGVTAFSVVDAVEIEGVIINKGLYFAKDGQGKYVSSLTYGGDFTHKIDKKYLPNSRAMVKVNQNNTYDEILEILDSGLMPYMELPGGWRNAWLYVSRIGDGKIYFGSPAIATPFGTENFSTYVDNNGWGNIVDSDSVSFSAEPYDDGTYTLTCTRTNGNNVFSWELAT